MAFAVSVALGVVAFLREVGDVHGLVAVAGDAITAAYRLEGVESIAKVLTLARLTGGEKDLGDAECAGIREIYFAKRR